MAENKPIILDGKKVADEILSKIPNQNGKELAIITVGDDDASKVYVKNIIKAAERVGLKGVNYKFDENISFKNLTHFIENLHRNENITGIMVQHPIPKHLKGIENFIDPEIDVDGIGMYNITKLLLGETPAHRPATPDGIMALLKYYNISVEGKNVVIIGRSDIVGKPLAAMMLANNATVTVCHSKTENLRWITRRADIIVSAAGKAKFIDCSYLAYYFSRSKKPVIIDVGMNRDENGKLCGDVDFDSVLPHVSAITRVPGGIGPMTIALSIKHCTK